MSLDEKRLLGYVYVFPSTNPRVDAEVSLWVRQSELESGLYENLYEFIQNWVEQKWPLKKIAYPGRAMSWQEYSKE